MDFKIELFGEESTLDWHNNYGAIYKAVRSSSFGMSVDDEIIFGLTLVVVDKGNNYDALAENISNIGNEFICHFPKEGLIEGAYYESSEKCTSVDWESGNCDDTEVYITRVI